MLQRPKILEDVGFDIYLDTAKLRDLPLPIQEIKVTDLLWCFDFPVWEKDGTDDWNLTPREVINNQEETTSHRKKVEDADLSYPIVVIHHKNKWVILDGIHRLVKAFEIGNEVIQAKVLTQDNPLFISALRKL